MRAAPAGTFTLVAGPISTIRPSRTITVLGQQRTLAVHRNHRHALERDDVVVLTRERHATSKSDDKNHDEVPNRTSQ